MSHWSHPWYADCLSVVSILAMSQEPRKLRKLARQFHLVDEGPDPDITEMFVRLHEACHHDLGLANAIARELDDRFRSTVVQVRSQSLDRIKSMEMSWTLPLLWAVLRDKREEVRSHGRYLVHALLWNALRHTSADRTRENGLERTIEKLEELRKMGDENRRLQRLLTDQRPRPEIVRPDELGEGRLAREARKLRHDMERKEERIKELENILSDSSAPMPETLSMEAPAGHDGGKSGACPLQSHSPSPQKPCCRGEDRCCETCPLEGLRVAVIGGLRKMVPEYREVVRQLGAELLFHDGEVRNGSHRLKSLVCGADIIVFITSYNSHGALSVVRGVCKKKGKKLIALRETGAESLTRTLRSCAA